MPANVTSPGKAADAPMLSSNALPIGTRIHEFEITRVIGEGGFSVVYLAFDHTLHRSIALKEYIPSALASRRGDQTVAVRSAQHQATFEAGLRSFINEARLLAQFDHPALVKVFRFWEANGTAYMAMPYYEGRTLKAILREHPEQASEAWLKRLLVPLLDALALLHAHRCYHRDIAPDNIQVLDNEQPVLLDFGAARRTIGDMTQAFTVILKPGYAPIEQYAEETDLKQGPWTDIYALAAVLYGAIVGKPPPTAVARVIKDPLEPLASRDIAGFDATFLSGIDRGLAVRPEARPQSIAQWRGLLGMEESFVRPGDASSFASWGRPSEARAAGGKADPGTTREIEDAGDDAARAAEADRTILVPGLRRPVAAAASAPPEPASPVEQSATAKSPTHGIAAKKSAMKAMAAIVGVVALVAVVAWFAIAPPSGHVEQAPAAATPKVATSPPAQAPTVAAPNIEVSRPTQAPPATVAKAEPAPGTQARAAVAPHPAEHASAEVPEHARSEAAANAPSPPPLAEVAPEKPRPPAIPEDERRWAALRDSDNIDDLRAFRQRYPQSRHAQEAAVRIQQLVRQSRENTREASAAPPAKSAAAPAIAKVDEAARSPRAGAAERATPAAASTGTVRIRVQPFGYVYVDGALVGPSPPARELQLSPGRHQIEARNEQENPPVVRREVNVTGAGSTDVPLRFGQ